jgi:osmoprotectant transport system substrate-binding protein
MLEEKPGRAIGRREALRLLGAAALGSAVLPLSSCRSERANTIVVGSKNFTEQVILGELFAQQIEARTKLRADRRLDLGGTLICHQAMLAGQMDVYPEYTGTALTAILNAPPSSDATAVYETVRKAYLDRFGLEVGPPLGFNNTFALVVRGEDATQLHLRSISDLVPLAGKWRAGFGYEFMERPDGYPGLAKAYGLNFAMQPHIMDLGLLYRALQQKQVDVVAGNSTDGLIATLGMVVLEDDRHYFPPYQAVAIMRGAALRDHPEVRDALNALGGKISEDQMRRMNYAVDGQHADAAAVVRNFRQTQGL